MSVLYQTFNTKISLLYILDKCSLFSLITDYVGINVRFRMHGSYVPYPGTADKSLLLASDFYSFDANSVFYLDKQLYISSVEARWISTKNKPKAYAVSIIRPQKCQPKTFLIYLCLWDNSISWHDKIIFYQDFMKRFINKIIIINMRFWFYLLYLLSTI